MRELVAKSESVVLVVEDEAESRDTLRELLELEGYTVQTAADGKAALELLETVDPCVVLLDLFMPVMDGWQVIDRLRADGRLGRMNVLVITSAGHRAPSDLRVLQKKLAQLEAMLACSIVGSGPTVRRGLRAFAARTEPDELIVTAQIFDHPARLRSFEIVADIAREGLAGAE